jgi:hypothetical protein
MRRRRTPWLPVSTAIRKLIAPAVARTWPVTPMWSSSPSYTLVSAYWVAAADSV